MSYVYLTYKNVPAKALNEIVEEIKEAGWMTIQFDPDEHASSEGENIDDYLKFLIQSCSVMLFLIGDEGLTSDYYKQETLFGQRMQKDLVCLTLSDKYPASSTQGVPSAWKTVGIAIQARSQLHRTLGVYPPLRNVSTVENQRITYPDQIFCPHCRKPISLDYSRTTARTNDMLALRINIPQSRRSGSDGRGNKQTIDDQGYDFMICQKCNTILGASWWEWNRSD